MRKFSFAFRKISHFREIEWSERFENEAKFSFLRKFSLFPRANEMWNKCDFSFSLQTLVDSRPVFIGLFIKVNNVSPFYLYPIFKKIHDIKFPRGRYLLIVLYCTVVSSQSPKLKRVSLNEILKFPFRGLNICVDFGLRN